MNKHTIILLVFLAILLTLFYFSTESGHDRELRELQKTYLEQIYKERSKAEQWRRAALEYGNQFRREAARANKAENKFNYLREENEILRKRPVVKYSNDRLDSAFSARYD